MWRKAWEFVYSSPWMNGAYSQVGVEVHDVERLAEGPHDGEADGVVAADDDRHRPLPKDLAGHAGDVAEGVDDVGGQDVGVADVDDPTLQHLRSRKWRRASGP
jgi:hypothetical protein